MSCIFASSGVFLPFFELHLAHAATCYKNNIKKNNKDSELIMLKINIQHIQSSRNRQHVSSIRKTNLLEKT